jgi:hypothetical protein
MAPLCDNACSAHVAVSRRAECYHRQDLRQVLVTLFVRRLSRRKEFHIPEKWCFGTKAPFPIAWNHRS